MIIELIILGLNLHNMLLNVVPYQGYVCLKNVHLVQVFQKSFFLPHFDAIFLQIEMHFQFCNKSVLKISFPTLLKMRVGILKAIFFRASRKKYRWQYEAPKIKLHLPFTSTPEKFKFYKMNLKLKMFNFEFEHLRI